MPLIPIPLIAAGASLLGGLFSRRGGLSDEQRELSEEASRQQVELLQELLPEIQRQQRLESLMSLRQALQTAPGLAQVPAFQEQASALGVNNPLSLAPGAVPLQRAVNNLAFGLLPRFARSSAEGGGVFQGTSEQQALLNMAPRNENRFGRFGFGQADLPFDNPTPRPIIRTIPGFGR